MNEGGYERGTKKQRMDVIKTHKLWFTISGGQPFLRHGKP